jgi:hypothetical protein
VEVYDSVEFCMNYLYWLGLLMFITAGALLHDVPWLRFITAMLLISVGTIFMILSKGTI